MAKKIRINAPAAPAKKYTALSQGLLVAVCFLIFYPPFLRGLYFDQEMTVSLIFTAVLVLCALVLKVKKRDYSFLTTPLDGAILLYAVAYLLAVINAVHIGEAVWGFLKALNYFLIYMLVAEVVPDLKAARTVLNTLLAAAVGVAVIGLMAATGFSDYPGAFVNNHIMSTLQYHNTTAAYLGAMCFVGCAMLLTAAEMHRRMVYSGAVYLMALVTVTAISKGALLIIMAAAGLFFLGISGRYRRVYLYNLLYIFIMAFLTSSLLMQQITGTEPARGIIVILAGLCLALTGQPLGKKLSIINRAKYFKTASIAVLITLILCAGVFITTSAGQNFMPQDLTEEISEIADLSDSSYIYRVDFFRWGIDIARDYPLFGSGAGGWKALLPQYQDYKYSAADAHNHMIQVLVETGILGLIIYIAIWVLAITAVLKFNKKARREKGPTDEARVLLWGVFAAAAAIGLHSLIDFDLSIPAIFIVLITLLALINKITGFAEDRFSRQNKWQQLIIPGLITLILLLSGCSLAVGNVYADKANEQLKEIEGNQLSYAQHRETAIICLEKSLVFAPLNADTQVDLSKCYASLYLDLTGQESPNAPAAYQKTLSAIEKAEKLMPYDTKTINGSLNSAVTIGNLDASLGLARKIVQIEPNRSRSYEVLGEVLYAAARFYLENGDKDTAKKYIDELKDLPSVVDGQAKNLNQERLSSRMGRPLIVTEELEEIIKKTDELQFMYDILSSAKEATDD